MAEAVTLVARIIQSLQVSVLRKSKIELETGASLRAKGGINLRFAPIYHQPLPVCVRTCYPVPINEAGQTRPT